MIGVFVEENQALTALVMSCLTYDAIPPPAFDPASRTSMQRFVRKSQKLLRIMSLWRRSSPVQIQDLVDQLVGEALKPVLGRTWDGGGKEMAGQVSLPAPFWKTS